MTLFDATKLDVRCQENIGSLNIGSLTVLAREAKVVQSIISDIDLIIGIILGHNRPTHAKPSVP